MRLSILLLIALISGASAMAQNNITVFSEDGEQFTLYLNGEQVNQDPAARVIKRGITAPAAALRVVFEGDIAPDLKKNFSFMEKNTHVTAKISMTKKGYRLRYFGEEPIGEIEEEMSVSEEQIDVYEVQEEVRVDGVEPSMSTTTTTTVSTSTETTESPAGGESVQMSIGIEGFEMDVNMSVNDEQVQQELSTTTTTTTTITTSSEHSMTHTAEQVEEPTEVLTVSGNCHPPLQDTSSLTAAIEGEAFAEDKMNVAKQALRNACVEVEAVKRLAGLFDFEDDRLEFLKFCYDRTADTENYYQVNSVLDYSSSKEELNEYLESR